MALTDAEKQMVKNQLIKEINGDPDFFVTQLLADLPPAAQVRWIAWLKQKHNAECDERIAEIEARKIT